MLVEESHAEVEEAEKTGHGIGPAPVGEVVDVNEARKKRGIRNVLQMQRWMWVIMKLSLLGKVGHMIDTLLDLVVVKLTEHFELFLFPSFLTEEKMKAGNGARDRNFRTVVESVTSGIDMKLNVCERIYHIAR